MLTVTFFSALFYLPLHSYTTFIWVPAATDELHELKIKSGLGSGISESGGGAEIMVNLSRTY